MFTQIDLIRESGHKAGKASKRGDESNAQFHRRWAQRAIQLEDDPEAARQAFKDAYNAAAARRVQL